MCDRKNKKEAVVQYQNSKCILLEQPTRFLNNLPSDFPRKERICNRANNTRKHIRFDVTKTIVWIYRPLLITYALSLLARKVW